jgi:hypothetical protein
LKNGAMRQLAAQLQTEQLQGSEAAEQAARLAEN